MNPDQSERSGILAGGNWIVDRTKMIDVYPAQDSLANIICKTSSNGGSPYNVLIDLARLQAPFPLAAAGLVGDDPAGEFILSDCRAHEINTEQLRTCKEAPSSYTDVMTVQSTGRRTFFSSLSRLCRNSQTILSAYSSGKRVLWKREHLVAYGFVGTAAP